MASTPKMECIPGLSLHFPGLEEMGKFLWEGREKSLPSWHGCLNLVLLKVAIVKFIGKMQVWYYEKWVGRHASFPPRRSVKKLYFFFQTLFFIFFPFCLDKFFQLSKLVVQTH